MQLYDSGFFDWVDATAARSAAVMAPQLKALTNSTSIVDVGCGRGTWLAAWRDAGVADIQGLDGDYVDRSRLAIDPIQFQAADLAGSSSQEAWGLSRRFDVAQSLEVAEHLPPASGPGFAAALCALADIVVFSAAQPGQGGENHINERPVAYWAALFAAHGYEAYDCVRPVLENETSVAPWYRYNTVVYANATGQKRLSETARGGRVTDLETLNGGGDLAWRLRAVLLRPMPVAAVTALSKLRYTVAVAAQRTAKARGA